MIDLLHFGHDAKVGVVLNFLKLVGDLIEILGHVVRGLFDLRARGQTFRIVREFAQRIKKLTDRVIQAFIGLLVVNLLDPSEHFRFGVGVPELCAFALDLLL